MAQYKESYMIYDVCHETENRSLLSRASAPPEVCTALFYRYFPSRHSKWTKRKRQYSLSRQ